MAERIQSKRTIPVERDANAVPVIPRAPSALETWVWSMPEQAVSAAEVYFDLFNAAGSGAIVRCKSLRAIALGDTLAVVTLGVRLNLFRTSAVGTGGTAWVDDSPTASVAGGAVVRLDTSNADLPAEITGRHLPSGGANADAWLSSVFVWTDESPTDQFAEVELLPCVPYGQELTLREGEGIVVSQGSVAGAGSLLFRLVFSVE